MKQTKMPASWWLDKENLARIHYEIPLSHKKEETCIVCDKMVPVGKS